MYDLVWFWSSNDALLNGQRNATCISLGCQGADAKMGVDVQEMSWRREPERQGALLDHTNSLTPVDEEGEGRMVGKEGSQTIAKFQERFKPVESQDKLILKGVLHLTE